MPIKHVDTHSLHQYVIVEQLVPNHGVKTAAIKRLSKRFWNLAAEICSHAPRVWARSVTECGYDPENHSFMDPILPNRRCNAETGKG